MVFQSYAGDGSEIGHPFFQLVELGVALFAGVLRCAYFPFLFSAKYKYVELPRNRCVHKILTVKYTTLKVLTWMFYLHWQLAI